MIFSSGPDVSCSAFVRGCTFITTRRWIFRLSSCWRNEVALIFCSSRQQHVLNVLLVAVRRIWSSLLLDASLQLSRRLFLKLHRYRKRCVPRTDGPTQRTVKGRHVWKKEVEVIIRHSSRADKSNGWGGSIIVFHFVDALSVSCCTGGVRDWHRHA